MISGLPPLFDAFERLHVLVIGEAMLDRYLDGAAGRISPEAPVPVITIGRCHDVAGGAANSAANARALGCSVSFLSVLGDDAASDRLGTVLAAQDIPLQHLIVEPGRRTLIKSRVSAGGQILVRFDEGSTEPIGSEAEALLIEALSALYPACDAVIVSDYGYGILTPRVIQALADLQARHPRVLAIDSKDLRAYSGVGATLVKPNFAQAAAVLGDAAPYGPGDRAEAVLACGERILDLTGARIAAVTLDGDGAIVIERARPLYRTFARPVPRARAAGAGDTYLTAFAAALAAGAQTPIAAELAAAAASVVITKDGTATCSRAELQEHFLGVNKYLTDPDRLTARLALYRSQGKRIVFTNGCFDILHRGHVTYLAQAKALGDILIVGLNSDASVRRLKGPGRPINSLEDRAEVLAALSCVDHIVPFAEDTPVELIRMVQPDVFVKGGDYRREMLPEAAVVEDMGGVVRILPYVEDRSTTGMIERVRESARVTSAGGRRSAKGEDRGTRLGVG
jgi:D-beta-D-heptose 7-phosphate kinase/D-beta-D-heptose 1-phosphate adenosyltransferase